MAQFFQLSQKNIYNISEFLIFNQQINTILNPFPLFYIVDKILSITQKINKKEIKSGKNKKIYLDNNRLLKIN